MILKYDEQYLSPKDKKSLPNFSVQIVINNLNHYSIKMNFTFLYDNHPSNEHLNYI